MGKKKSAEKEKLPSAKPAKPSEEDVLALTQKLAENGISEVNSRLISDKLSLDPDRGRQQVRQVMKKLAKDGKVTVEKKTVNGKRKRYIYQLK